MVGYGWSKRCWVIFLKKQAWQENVVAQDSNWQQAASSRLPVCPLGCVKLWWPKSCFDLLAVHFYNLQLSDDVCLIVRIMCRQQLLSSRGMWNDLIYITGVANTKMVICRKIKDSWDMWPSRRREISLGTKIRLLKIYVFLILVYVEESSRRLMCVDSWLFKMNS